MPWEAQVLKHLALKDKASLDPAGQNKLRGQFQHSQAQGAVFFSEAAIPLAALGSWELSLSWELPQVTP